MSKEEVLLELVLDKFSNIKEVLNATKDIEYFLMKLKLNKKRGIGVILNKTKNLVDSLFDHSAKVKDEFYEHYNKLENISIENDKDQENDKNLSKEQSQTKSKSNDGSDTWESADDNEENGDNVIDCNIVQENKGNNIVQEENLESVDPLSVPVNTESTNVDVAVIECNRVEESEDPILEENNPESLLEDPFSSDVVGTILDNNTENVNNDNSILESNNSNSDTSKKAAEEMVVSDIVESSILDSGKESDDEKNREDTAEPEQKPKALIRLVDLSKLIDPKPKKSVKFDNSVIILTSSDEETNTPKKKVDVKDLSIKLKSALKNSPLNENSNSHTKVKNKTKCKGKSEINLLRNKTGKKYDENSSDSDNPEFRNEKDKDIVKSKHYSKRDRLDLDHTKRSDTEDIKQKSLKSTESTSGDDSDGSDTNRKNNEAPTNNSRRSSRIDNKQNMTQARRENLRKIFKRKSGRSGKSNFEIVNGKSNDSSSDYDSKTKRKSSRRKKDLKVEHLSDTSSFSDDENKDVRFEKKSKNKKKKQVINLSIDVESNEKFSYKVYIPLPRIECSRLKDVYLRNKEILEIKSLSKINLSRSSKRSRAIKNDSKSSSDTEKPKSKKPKNKLSKDESPSDNESVTNDVDKDVNKNIAENKLENADETMVAIAMEQLKNSNESQNKSDSDDSETDEKEKEKSKNKESDKCKDTENQEKKQKKSDKSQKKPEGDDSGSDAAEKKKSNKNEDTNNSTDTDDQKKSDSDSSRDLQKEKSKKKWHKDKLLTSKISSSDSEEEFSKYVKKKDKSREEIMRKAKKRSKKAVLSDSENSGEDKKKNDEESSDDESKSSDEKSDSSNEKESDKEKEKTKRKRIKRTNDSSSSDEEKSTRKQIRRLIGKDALSETTKKAEAEEKERKARIAEKQKKYNNYMDATSDSKVEKVVLNYDEKNKKELIAVHPKIVKKLKPHQASGVQFMWDACFESLERSKSTKGSGCILAHCMGLGKTLQVIALAHTLLTNSEKTGVTKIMVVCPLNTVLNWKAEFKKWLPKDDLEIYELVSCKQNYERQYVVQEWHNDGGVLILGYHMFRNLSNPDNRRISKKVRTTFQEGFLDPGPDLVICDEGHLLKNEKTNLSIAMNRIKTARRIVLTGTPLQNNLKEYWCMVQFIKPNLLGTYKEYLNRFVNPIINGQYTDSTQHDILLMRKRSHVLHKLLDGVVQRRDYAVLEPYLPPKHEYVLFVALTETQVKLYTHYMEKFARRNEGSIRTSFLFTDFQVLQRICTHPRVLLDKTNEKKERDDLEEDSEGSLKEFIDDGEASESASSSSSSSSKSNSGSDEDSDDKKEKKSKSQQKVRLTRALAAQRKENNEDDSELEIIEEIRKEWWQEYCDGDELDNINNSGKLFLLFQILKECEEIGDKILVFSQSLFTLNCIEYFLEKIDEATQKGETDKVGGHSGSWALGLDYFRLDGSSSCDNRALWCDNFNNPNNIRARLFLISTKAGGLGINLVAANRVIIFDVSWNPSHDIQSIYRVYRFGQTKPCYIYRFVTYGAMEMKIYERQVTKQAISKRVIDEQQIDRHYNQNDLQELYRCDLEPTDRPIPMVPKDILLGELLQKYDKTIYKYHLHQSLLENKEAEGLNEEERKAAWEEFENEKVLRKNTGTFDNMSLMNAHAIEAALTSIVRKDNPTWSDVQIRGIIPALVQQLQVQLAAGDITMYSRVQQEMQIMQALRAQKLKEAYYQQQVMRLIQQQEQQAKMLGNMNINPSQMRINPSVLNNLLTQRQGGPSSAPSRPLSNDVIELND